MVIKVTTQAEFDVACNLKNVKIVIDNTKETIYVKGNSSVEAWENSSVVAWENSRVVAWENSRVEARENSSVVARENSSVVARENSRVEAWGNSRVEAWACVVIYLFSQFAQVTLNGQSVCWKHIDGGKIEKHSEDSVIFERKEVTTTNAWVEKNGIKILNDKVILYKRVSIDFKTQENTKNETCWSVGIEVVHSNWEPTSNECGEGKFHACIRPYFCDEFRSKTDDKYVAIEIAISDIYVWKEAYYTYKVAFRAGKVIYECNQFGEKIG